MKKRKMNSTMVILLAGMLGAVAAQAADGTWNANSAGNWSDTSKWSGGIVADGSDFSAYLSNVINANRIITLDGARTIGNIYAQDTSHDYTVNGTNTLTLSVSSGTPTIDVVSGRIFIIGGNNGFRLDGTQGLSKTGAGILRIAIANNNYGYNPYYPLSGVLTITGGTVRIGDASYSEDYVLFNLAFDTTGTGSGVGLDVGNAAVDNPWLGGLRGSVDLATAVVAGYSGVVSLTLNTLDGTTHTFSGVITNGAATTALNKQGYGTQIFTGVNTYTGASTVKAGTLTLGGSNGSALNSAFTIGGGTLWLDNSTAWIDRISDSAALSLGSLTLQSSDGAGNQTETVGATTFAVSGKVTINNGSGGGDQTTLAMGAVTRSDGAAIDFSGTNGTLGGGADSPNVTSSGAFPSASNGILPWATVGGTQWAEDNSGSIRAYSGTFVDPTSAASDATANAQLTGSGTMGSAKSFNSLNVISSGAGQSLSLGGNLTLTSNNGGILKSGTDAYTISGAGNITAGNQLIVHVDGGDLTISAPLNTSILKLAKGGSGNLILSGTRAGTMSGAISIADGSLEFQGNANTTLSGVISGAGDLICNLNAGKILTINNNSNSFSGKTIAKGGIFRIGTAYNVKGFPGDYSAQFATSNLEITNAIASIAYYFGMGLGDKPGQVQLTGGTAGFAQYGNTGHIKIFGTGDYELIWGSEFFKPDVFVLGDSIGSNQELAWYNKIDLNGATRTISNSSTTKATTMSGVVRNSSGTAAGITKVGAGTIILSAAPAYDGDTTVSAGTLQFNAANPSNDASAVSIAEGAVINLSFSGNDTVDSLYIGGTQKVAGVYGNTNSGADNGGEGVGAYDAYFGTGVGTITCTADIIAPTLESADIADDVFGGPIVVGAEVTYTVSFSEDMDSDTVSTADFGNAGTATITIDSVTETAADSGVFTVVVTTTGTGTLQLKVNASAELLDVSGNALVTTSAIADDTEIDVTAGDTTPPTVVSMVDDQGGGPVTNNTLITYTVTFSEDIDATTVAAGDFGTTGTASATIQSANETSADSGVFTVPVLATSGGTLRFQINASAVIWDVASNALDTTSAILDDETITVDAVVPTLAAGNIVDDRGGAAMILGEDVVYTITFSEDIDEGTFTSADLGNAGSALMTVDSIAETSGSSGIFNVTVSPTTIGTLQLQVNQDAVITDPAGNPVDTSLAIVDTAVITVTAPTLTWDANAATADQTDGGGTWLNANQWWNTALSANFDWAGGSHAVIGNGGNGGTITLGTISAASVTLTNYSGTYILSGGTLTNSAGITVAGVNATINSAIGGTGGITKSGSGVLLLTADEANAYEGKTLVSGGLLQLGTSWSNAASLPGGIGAASSGSNLEINGGNVRLAYTFRRTLGDGAGEVQLTGGASGFSYTQSDNYGDFLFNNDAVTPVVWGSAFFKPDVLVLNEAAASPTQSINFQNRLDLNGTNRVVACNSTLPASNINSSNGNMPTTGGRLTGIVSNSGGTPAGLIKIGPGILQLEAANTYDGGTTVSNGLLRIANAAGLPVGGDLTVNGGSVDLVSYTVSIGNLNGVAGTSITNNGSLTVTQASNGLYGGNIAGTGSLTKAGAAALTLSGTNTYTGATTVSAGTLMVNGELAAGSAVTVNSGAALGGSGTIGGNAEFESGSTFAAGEGALAVDGTLTLTGSVTIEFSGTPSTSPLVVATYGTLSGTFSTLNIPTGWSVDHEYEGNKIALTGPRGSIFRFK